MEYYATLKLSEHWGKQPCSHPRLEKVYYTGAFIISYACVQCGAEFTIAQKMELDENRRKKTGAELQGSGPVQVQ